MSNNLQRSCGGSAGGYFPGSLPGFLSGPLLARIALTRDSSGSASSGRSSKAPLLILFAAIQRTKWVFYEPPNQGFTRLWLDRKQAGNFRGLRANAIVAADKRVTDDRENSFSGVYHSFLFSSARRAGRITCASAFLSRSGMERNETEPKSGVIIDPLALDPDVGFVHSPTVVGRSEPRAQTSFHFWGIRTQRHTVT